MSHPCACGLSLSIALESHVGGGEREEGEHETHVSTPPTVAQMAPQAVLLLGDSNFSFYGTRRQPWRWVSRWTCGTIEYPSLIRRMQDAAPCPVAYIPLPQLRGLNSVEMLLESTARLLPKPAVCLVAAGQNDADEWSRYSTRGPVELQAEFRAVMLRRVRRLETILMRADLQPIWILPFDYPEGQFTPLYTDLVAQLREVLQEHTQHLAIDIRLQFEDDQYHLLPWVRRNLAHWLWNAVATGSVLPPKSAPPLLARLGRKVGHWVNWVCAYR